jgi:uncharacterized protein YccT (UPF0319 family)
MKKLLYFLILTGAMSVNSAELSISHTLKLHAVNNEAPTDSEVIELPTGENQLVVSYGQILKDGSQSRFYSSLPYVLEFDVEEDVPVVLNPPKVRRYRDAQTAFSKSTPRFTLQQNSNDLELTVYELTSDNEITPFTDIVDLVQENNRLSGKLFTGEGIVYIADMATSSSGLSNSSDPVRQLQTWYLKASKKQRKEFRKWMVDQE